MKLGPSKARAKKMLGGTRYQTHVINGAEHAALANQVLLHMSLMCSHNLLRVEHVDLCEVVEADFHCIMRKITML